MRALARGAVFVAGFPFVPVELRLAAEVVAVLEADEFATDFAEALPAFLAIGEFVELVDVFGHFGGHDAGKVFEEIAGAFIVFEFGALFGQVAEIFLAVLVTEPILIAALAPFGEVLLADRIPSEDGVEEFIRLRQFIDPGEHGCAEFAVEEAEVEFFAGLARETGDFADASFHRCNF